MSDTRSIEDADGKDWCYRLTSSRLERREWGFSVWFEVKGVDMLRMTPRELRFVADVLEGLIKEPCHD